MMKGARRLRSVFRCVTMLLVLTTLRVGTAASQSALVPSRWSAVPISGGENLRAKDPVDLAVSDDGEIAVTWARATDSGVSVRHRQESSWAWLMDRYVSPVGSYAWSPTLAYSGTQRVDVWIRGEKQFTCANPVYVRQYDAVGTSLNIGESYYSSFIKPDLAAGSSGWHIVFAAGSSMTDCTGSKVDLYYARRPSLGAAWSAPTVVITHSAVISSTAVGGGIAYPNIALSPDGDTLHVVWEQQEQFPGPVIRTSAWYISGTLSPAGAVTWSPPVRISPETYALVVRPDVAVTSDGQVHLVWTRVEGSRAEPTGQYLYYRRMTDGVLEQLTEEAEPIRVNTNFPTLVSASVATYGDTVCAAWHGYSGAQGSGLEDIYLICSEDGGDNWGSVINISHSAEYLSILPQIEFSPSGSLHAVWVEYELGSGPYSVFYGPAFRIFMPLVLRKG